MEHKTKIKKGVIRWLRKIHEENKHFLRKRT